MIAQAEQAEMQQELQEAEVANKVAPYIKATSG